MRRTELQPAVEAGILSAAQADRLAEFLATSRARHHLAGRPLAETGGGVVGRPLRRYLPVPLRELIEARAVC